jgi:hypothetical protein
MVVITSADRSPGLLRQSGGGVNLASPLLKDGISGDSEP